MPPSRPRSRTEAEASVGAMAKQRVHEIAKALGLES